MDLPLRSGGDTLRPQGRIALSATGDQSSVDVQIVENLPHSAQMAELVDDQSHRGVLRRADAFLMAGTDRLDQGSGDTARVAGTSLDRQRIFESVDCRGERVGHERLTLG